MTKEEVLKLVDQVAQELDGLNSVEVRVVIAGVLNKLNMPQIPIHILGDMAKVMQSNQIVITEDEGGWDVAFKINKERLKNGLDLVDEFEADEYEEAPEGADLEAIEKESILNALRRNDGSRKRAAEDLHISERSLYRKIEKYGIMKDLKQ